MLRVDWNTGAQTVIASHDKVDISDWTTDPRTHEVTAFSANYIRDTWIAIDPATGRDLARLEHEFDAAITVASQSDDDTLWVVGAARPDRPACVAPARSEHGKDHLSVLVATEARQGEACAHARRGHRRARRPRTCLLSDLPAAETGTRPAHPMPTVLFVHGGPWARDGWHYNRDVQWLANRGYAVLQVNYRGSMGFGKAFTNAGDREWAGKMHDDLIDAVNWSIAEGIADPKRIAIYGASYGGYASFVGATFTPDVFCCSVPVVGITNLETLLANPPPYWASFYETECHRIGDPRTADGVALLRARSPLHRAGDIKKPMLIGHGANDVRCKVAESDQIVAAMTEKRIPVIYVVFPDEGHGFARPENSLAFRAIMESFLARHLGGRAEPVGDDFKGSSHDIRAGRGILQDIGV